MYGAIYGDLIGSLYEYREFLEHDVKTMIEASKREELLSDDCFYSDDTILTIAVRDAFVNHKPYDATLKKYILENSAPLNKDGYFQYMFSPNIIKCAKGNMRGESEGNGALMRISSIPYLSRSAVYMFNEVINATMPTHNSASAMKAVACLSSIIYMAKEHEPITDIKRTVDQFYGYKYDFDLDTLRNDPHFNRTCEETMPIVLYVIFNTHSFDEAMRLTLSLGKDTDTNCAIVGSVAESLYGMDDELKRRVDTFIPKPYQKILSSNGKLM